MIGGCFGGARRVSVKTRRFVGHLKVGRMVHIVLDLLRKSSCSEAVAFVMDKFCVGSHDNFD